MAHPDISGYWPYVPCAVDKCNAIQPVPMCGCRCSRVDGHLGACRCGCGTSWGTPYEEEMLMKYGKHSQEYLDACDGHGDRDD